MEKKQQMEQFSRAFVYAIAAQAGCNHSVPEVDDHSVDLSLSTRISGSLWDEPKLDVQLKSTAERPESAGDILKYVLHNIKNYNDLRKERLQVQRILVVVYMPENSSEWIEYRDDYLKLYRNAFWVSLRGKPDISNKSSVTVDIPVAQRFNATVLTNLMKTIANGEDI